jgi:hypothetical protein
MLIANPLEESEWLFPVAECFHILGFAVSIGTIAMVDFCLLGAGPARKDAAKLARDLAPWTLVGLADMLFTGALLFVGNGGVAGYWYKDPFRFKMYFLVAAIGYHYTIHRKATAPDFAIGTGKVVAAVSLGLWLSVLTFGLFIGFSV